MTSADAPATHERTGAIVRAWRGFRRWRRSRPFWGGLFTLLAGLEILGSSQLTLGELQLKVGLEGFQAYLIPATLILAGLLAWLTPAQRIFYGVLATLVSVYSLIGVNLGGFFLGMLLGILGGALTASWTALRPAPEPSSEDDDETHDTDDGDDQPGGPAPDEQPIVPPERPRTGPLTDVLPTSMSSPIPAPRHAREPADPAAGGDEEPPRGGAQPHRGPRLFAITLVPAALIVAMTALPAVPPALADVCPAPGVAAGTVLASAAATSSPTADPQPSTSATPGPSESPTPAPAPCPTAEPSGSVSGVPRRPAPQPSLRPTTTTPPRLLDVPTGQPLVAKRPGRMTGTRLSMVGLTYDGVVDLPAADGTIRVLQFSMRSSTTDGFELRIPESNGAATVLRSTQLTVAGNVKFYASRFTGKLGGVIEVTFTPDSPPPPLASVDIFFTDADIQLVFVSSDSLTAELLRVLVVR